MRIVVIGGTGHIGTFLVPRLVTAGHEVTVITRGHRQPYQPHSAWKEVRRVEIDRRAAERDGKFGPAIRDLHPEVVMDMLCFDVPSAQQLVEALEGEIQLLAHCGTIWVHGYGVQVPVSEDQPRNPWRLTAGASAMWRRTCWTWRGGKAFQSPCSTLAIS